VPDATFAETIKGINKIFAEAEKRTGALMLRVSAQKE
jgi:hypothetical protein